MGEQIELKWKTPVWKVSKGGGQVKRILRVSEARELIKNINVADQGPFKRMEITPQDARLWFQALLFTGMRLAELMRLKQNPTDRNGNSLYQRNGTLRLDKEIFYDVGKQKQVARERIVFLSEQGRHIIEKFIDEARMPRIIYGEQTAQKFSLVFNDMLQASARRIGFQGRSFTRTKRVPITDALGSNVYDDKGKERFKKITVPQDTTGIMTRVFRASWESWLVSARGKDEFVLRDICTSMGHTREVALEYYLASQFDKEDIEDMMKTTEGFGIVPERIS